MRHHNDVDVFIVRPACGRPLQPPSHAMSSRQHVTRDHALQPASMPLHTPALAMGAAFYFWHWPPLAHAVDSKALSGVPRHGNA
jgi:hypothetical protein